MYTAESSELFPGMLLLKEELFLCLNYKVLYCNPAEYLLEILFAVN
jgi:hypothetical protein